MHIGSNYLNYNINTKLENVNSIYMEKVKTTLDKAVHGHDKAKRHIERIIGQWINGEESLVIVLALKVHLVLEKHRLLKKESQTV